MPEPWTDAYVDSLLDKYAKRPANLARMIVDAGPWRGGLDYLGPDGESSHSMPELEEKSASVAAYLAAHGVSKGDRVGVLLPKGPELVVSALAVWRLGAAYVPLFTAFGTDAIAMRVKDSEASYVITDAANFAKVDLASMGSCRVLLVGEEPVGGTESWSNAVDTPPRDGYVDIGPQDMIVLLYTSGTTGAPKGVPVPLWALAGFEAYMTLGIGLRDSDRFWNLADPGWAYGLYYGLIGPMILGHRILYVNRPFDPNSVEEIWRRYGITNFAAAPTAYRAMRSAIGDRKVQGSPVVMSSAGEPLNPEVIHWAKATLGVEIRDHYGQTELGMVINNHNDGRLRNEAVPGSMGLPTPGIRAVVVAEGFVEQGPGKDGEVAIDAGASPLFWFPGYYRAPERTAERFSPDRRYYLTGDVASTDGSGNFFFAGRSDDVILTAGYRVGPFEVESAVMSHPKVAECAVIGVPDELRGESIRAYVVLRPGTQAGPELEGEIQQLVRERLSKTSYPREVLVVEELPKTPSGKVQRFLLRAGAAG
ncbi:MAG: AMP-binding protein [Actinomycetota bacterium]|nr:AMP-binding protein [Actinomycetota bacterium]MDA8207599.1 AMP-binding protein [Actinomycetota bacterium]